MLSTHIESHPYLLGTMSTSVVGIITWLLANGVTKVSTNTGEWGGGGNTSGSYSHRFSADLLYEGK